MKSRICFIVAVLMALVLTVSVFAADGTASTTERKNSTSTTNALGDIGGNLDGAGDQLESLAGNLNDAISEAGGVSGVKDKTSGILGNLVSRVSGRLDGIGDNDEDLSVAAPIDTYGSVYGYDYTQYATASYTPGTLAVPTTTEENVDGEYENKSVFDEPTAVVNTDSNKESVQWVQWYLNKLGYELSDDGISGKFDSQTLRGVRLFQASEGLDVTGEVNEATRKLMKKAYLEKLAKETTEPTTEKTTEPTTAEAADNDSSGVDVYKVLFFVLIAVVLVGGGAAGVFYYNKKLKNKGQKG